MPKDKKSKKGATQGFDGVKGDQTARRICLWNKNAVQESWRKWEVEKIRYTVVNRVYSYGGEEYVEKFISPFGMKETIKKRKKDARGKSSLPRGAHEALNIPENYDVKEVEIVTGDEGDLGFKEFYVLLCRKCHFSDVGFMKHFTNKYRGLLPSDPKISDIMDNWDKIVELHPSEMKYIDVVGCILPHEPSLHASPNEKNYILDPTDHAKKSKCHAWTLCTDSSSSSVPSASRIDVDTSCQASGSSSTNASPLTSPLASPLTSPLSSPLTSPLASPLTSPLASPTPCKRKSLISPTATKKQKLLTVGVDGTVTAEKTVTVKNTKTSTNTTITIKHQKKLVFKPIDLLLDPYVSVFKDPANQSERNAQNSCYSFVLSGCAKESSNNTTIEFYRKHISHLRKAYQDDVGHLEFDNRSLAKPMRAHLDKNNITAVQAALVKAYKHLTSSSVNQVLYTPFLEDDAHICVFTDGIQKFGKELNGAYARTADKELNITNAPISLHSIKGGSMNAEKLATDLISVIIEVKPIPESESAYACFIKDSVLGDLDEGPLSPPEYFKCCTIINQDNDTRKLDLLFVHWPVCITADGCKTNLAAVELLVLKIGILSPGTRCSAHAAHGSMRRLASSKTMSVPEVVEFATNIRPVLKHFKNNGKSLSLLNDALKILEMKTMKALTWCPTRMGYLLTSS